VLTVIRLRGLLGERYGREWKLDVRSPAEAVHAIEALKPGFYKTILDMKDVDFAVKAGAHYCGDADMLQLPCAGKEIVITPVLRGSGGGTGSILETVAGIVLIAAGIVISYYAAPLGKFIILLGVSLTLGGVASLLSPTPSIASTNPDSKHRTSYQFNGPINTIEEGQPVPVLYGGPLWVGSAVVSSDIEALPTGVAVSGSGGTPTGTSSSDVGAGFTGRPLL
jgi:predicted phage tail protein